MPQPYPNGEVVVVIDCSDLDRSARFWSAVLGYESGDAAGGRYHSLTPVSGVGIDMLCRPSLAPVPKRAGTARGAP